MKNGYIAPVNNFHFCVDCDTVEGRHGCDCDMICRCSTISSVTINDIDISSVIDIFICGGKKFSTELQNSLKMPIKKYTIERGLRAMGISERDNFEPVIVSGYYGQEIGNVTISSDMFGEMCTFIDDVLSITDDKKCIELALIAEYGYLLEDLKDKDFIGIEEITLTDIQRQSNHYRRVDQKTVKQYMDILSSKYEWRKISFDDMIVGVVIKSGNHYRIIDGYHRLTVYDKLKQLVGRFIVFE